MTFISLVSCGKENVKLNGTNISTTHFLALENFQLARHYAT